MEILAFGADLFCSSQGQRRQTDRNHDHKAFEYPESHRVSFPCDNSSRVARCRNHNTVVICHITGREYENEAKDGKPDEQSVRYDAHLTFYAERSTICWAGRRRDGCPRSRSAAGRGRQWWLVRRILMAAHEIKGKTLKAPSDTLQPVCLYVFPV